MADKKVRKTRRNRGFKNHLTVPEIKHAFDTIGRATYDILKEGGSSTEQVKKFQKVWKSVFHRPVTSVSAEAYLKIKRISAEKKPYAGTRKRKGSQKGGSALMGAPLDYVTRAGVDTVHGNFPAYQSAGLGFYDKVNQEGMFQECGTKDITPNLYGSGQSGGTLGDFIHQTFLSPSAPSTPLSAYQTAGVAVNGRSMPVSPAPYSQ